MSNLIRCSNVCLYIVQDIRILNQPDYGKRRLQKLVHIRMIVPTKANLFTKHRLIQTSQVAYFDCNV